MYAIHAAFLWFHIHGRHHSSITLLFSSEAKFGLSILNIVLQATISAFYLVNKILDAWGYIWTSNKQWVMLCLLDSKKMKLVNP